MNKNNLNETDLAITDWQWAIGSPLTTMEYESPIMNCVLEAYRTGILLNRFVSSITVDADVILDTPQEVTLRIAGLPKNENSSTYNLIKRAAKSDIYWDGDTRHLTPTRYLADLLTRRYLKLMVILKGDDGRFNYREFGSNSLKSFTCEGREGEIVLTSDRYSDYMCCPEMDFSLVSTVELVKEGTPVSNMCPWDRFDEQLKNSLKARIGVNSQDSYEIKSRLHSKRPKVNRGSKKKRK